MTRMTLVLGVHRSGTSLLTAGLQAIGLDLGRLPAERDPDNPRGYFENHVIRSFNDELLKALRASWDDTRFRAEQAGLDGPAWAAWRDRAAALLRDHYGGRDAVALKDPRITQLLPFWVKVLDELGWEQRHVLILRHPDEVAESQMQRAARRPGMFPRMNTPEAMHALWTSLMRTALLTLPPDQTLVVRHDRLLADPRKTLQALARKLGTRPDTNALKRFAAEFVDRSLHRAHVTAPVPSPERAEAVRIWEALTKDWGRKLTMPLPDIAKMQPPLSLEAEDAGQTRQTSLVPARPQTAPRELQHLTNDDEGKTMKARNPRVFAIGFNKCGTSSIHRLFVSSGYRSVHWNISENKFIANIMFSNIFLGKKVLDGIEDFDCYSDMNYLTNQVYLEANSLYKQIENDYPDTIFILNTRDKEKWIKSRIAHGDGTYLTRSLNFFKKSEAAVLDIWRASWDFHHASVRRHFEKSSKFIEFNIESDDIEKLADFLNEFDIKIITEKWEKANATRSDKK